MSAVADIGAHRLSHHGICLFPSPRAPGAQHRWFGVRRCHVYVCAVCMICVSDDDAYMHTYTYTYICGRSRVKPIFGNEVAPLCRGWLTCVRTKNHPCRHIPVKRALRPQHQLQSCHPMSPWTPHSSCSAVFSTQLCVMGGGVVGRAMASAPRPARYYQASTRLDRKLSSRNSKVIHAGL